MKELIKKFLEAKALAQGESIAEAVKITEIDPDHVKIQLPVQNMELMPPFVADKNMLITMTNDLLK